MSRRRGMALITVLLMTSVLFLMVLALIVALRGELFTSGQELNRTSALYLAEAGLADAMDALETNPTWSGVTNQAIPGVRGSYTVEFGSAAPFTSEQSVNNLGGAGWAESHRGPSTVPPNSALLIVRARVNGVERVLEATVTRGNSLPKLDDPLLTSGRIYLAGNVTVDGIKALDDNTPVAAGIHSNMGGSANDVINWDAGPGDTAVISGQVSTTSSGAGAIDMPGATIAGGTQTGAAAQALPTIDVSGTVLGMSSAPTPTLNPSGATVLASGDYYLSGDVSLNGDLVLNGARVYVNGKLDVNGSVTGDGSLYVNGQTSLRGTAAVVADPTKKVALFSKGSVTLDGFDGSAYLDSVATTDPQFATWLSEGRSALAQMQTNLETHTLTELYDATYPTQQLQDDLHAKLGDPGPGHVWAVLPAGDSDVMGLMAARLATQPPGPTRDFLVQKLQSTSDFFKYGSSSLAGDDATVVSNYLADNSQVMGLMDSVGDLARADLWPSVVNLADQYDPDRVGSSYFQGLVYTNGFIYATNEVKVVGAVIARSDGTQPSAVIGGRTVRPGDLYLANGTGVTFVEEMFNGSGFTGSTNALTVETWMGR